MERQISLEDIDGPHLLKDLLWKTHPCLLSHEQFTCSTVRLVSREAGKCLPCLRFVTEQVGELEFCSAYYTSWLRLE